MHTACHLLGLLFGPEDRGSMFSQNVSKVLPDYVRLEVLTAVTMKSTVSWGVTPCSLVEVHQCFWGMYCLHLQDQRVGHAINQQDVSSKQSTLLWYQTTWSHISEDSTLPPLLLHPLKLEKNWYQSIKWKHERRKLYMYVPKAASRK
jgi:hypothetical protein